ncbi:MAG: ABC transporter substrate-binding protein [Candidatus Puniceispirillales bacterium]
MTFKSIIAAAVALPMLATNALALDMGASDKTIKLAINEWTGQHLTTRVAGAVLERAGYSVEYVTAGYTPQFIAIGDGELHATLEIWTSNLPGQYADIEASGKIKDIGDLGLNAREGVLYPVHMKEMCPGLPDWEALNECAAKFATVDTLPQGRLLDYPADWGSPGKDRLEAMGMNFAAIPAGSEGALITELEASIKKKSPLLMTFWQPHWALSEYETEWVALPAGDDACYNDASWGVNPDATGDCDFSPTRIFKVVWSGFDSTWPMAGEILKNYSMDANDQQLMMAAVDSRGEDINKVVDEWINANSAAVDSLIAAAKAK